MEDLINNTQEEKYKVCGFCKIVTKDYYIKMVLSGLWGVDFILSYAPVRSQKEDDSELEKDPDLKPILEGAYKIEQDFDIDSSKKDIRISFSDGFISLRKTNESYTERFWSKANRVGCVPSDNQYIFVEIINSKYISWLKESKNDLLNFDLKHFVYFDFDDIYEIVTTKDPIITFRDIR